MIAAAPNHAHRCFMPIVVAVILGCVLRFAMLGHKPLWEDEAWTFHVAVAEQGVAQTAALDPHPQIFYTLYRALGSPITSSDWAFRLPSAVLSVAALLLWLPCLTLLRLDRSVRAWCVLLFAVLPLNIQFAQEARAYALTQCVAMLLLVTYLWVRSRSGGARWVWLVLVTAASCHIDGFGLATPGVLLIHALYEIRAARATWRLPITLVVGMLLAGPYYAYRVATILGSDQGMHVLPAASASLSLLAARLVAISPFGVTPSSLPPPLPPTLTINILAAAVVGLLVAAGVSASRRLSQPTNGLLWLLLVVPFVVFAVLCSLTGVDTIERRYLLVAVLGLVPLIVCGALHVARRVPGMAHMVLFVIPLAVSILWLAMPTARSSSDWRSMAAIVLPRVLPGDGFLHETFANYPLHPFGPLRAYAWRNRTPIATTQCHEYLTTVATPSRVVALVDPSHWPTPQDRQAIIDFLTSGMSNRVWTFTGDFALYHRLDLRPYAVELDSWHVKGLRATLWRVTGRPLQTEMNPNPDQPRSALPMHRGGDRCSDFSVPLAACPQCPDDARRSDTTDIGVCPRLEASPPKPWYYFAGNGTRMHLVGLARDPSVGTTQHLSNAVICFGRDQ